MRYAFNNILNDVSSFVGIDDPIEERGVDIDADVVFGVDDLVAHVDDFGFELDCFYLLCQWVVVVQSWFADAFILAPFLFEAESGGIDVFVGAAAASADVAEAVHVLFVALVAVCHQSGLN